MGNLLYPGIRKFSVFLFGFKSSPKLRQSAVKQQQGKDGICRDEETDHRGEEKGRKHAT